MTGINRRQSGKNQGIKEVIRNWVVQAIKKINKVHTQVGTAEGAIFIKRHNRITATSEMETTTISESKIVLMIPGNKSVSSGSMSSFGIERDEVPNDVALSADF
jgi:hypothetical protein